MDLERLTPDAVTQKVALDRNYRPIGRIDGVHEDNGRVASLHIAPHREFLRKHPECKEASTVVEARDVARLWGHTVVLDKAIDELVQAWQR